MNKYINFFVLFCTFISSATCVSIERKNHAIFHGSGAHIDKNMGVIDSRCNTLLPESLAEIMGPAYNPRYMSVIPPPESLQDIESNDNVNKRKTSEYNQFFVDDDYAQVLDDKPAWEIDHFRSDELSVLSESRGKRAADELAAESREKRAATASRPWECRAVVKWIDLGSDYFPRYLRTVECTKHDCWYGQFTCKPRSFTVKLLRRKKGKCVYRDRKEGVAGLPRELRELWVWEERAVNFCCDCAPP